MAFAVYLFDCRLPWLFWSDATFDFVFKCFHQEESLFVDLRDELDTWMAALRPKPLFNLGSSIFHFSTAVEKSYSREIFFNKIYSINIKSIFYKNLHIELDNIEHQ